MKTLKKLMALLLAVAMLATMVSCGKKEEQGETTAKQETTKKETTKKEETTTTEKEEEPFTLEIYTSLASANGIDANNLYWFRWAENKLQEMGYPVTLNVTGANGDEYKNGRAVRFSTNTLPDIMFADTLTAQEAVLYGDTDGMILDLTPYMTDEYMPNAVACAASEVGADGFAASYTPAGKIYGVPYIVDRTLGWNAGTRPNFNVTYVNTEMLEQLGKEMPTTVDEWIDLLRAAKNLKAEDGTAILPYLTATGSNRLIAILTAAMGFYGYKSSAQSNYGLQVAIKDGEITLPGYTEDFKKILEAANTMYKEGLIPSEYYTMDGDTKKALAAARNWLMVDSAPADFTDDPEVFKLYQNISPIAFEEGTMIAASCHIPYTCNKVYASAETEHPECCAALMDLLFDDESMMIYWYGPVIEDELGIYEYAWYVENGDLVHPKIKDGTYGTLNEHQFDNVSPNGQVGKCDTYNYYAKHVVAGLDFNLSYDEYTDVVTGKQVTVTNKSGYFQKRDTSVDAYGRLSEYESWKDNLTIVMPGMLYVDEIQSQRITDLTSSLYAYAEENIAAFITGTRSLDTFDKYLEELKAQGIEELLTIYQEGYAPYMATVFEE